MRQLGRVDLLILDDWGPEPLLAEQQRDLLEIVEERYNAGSLIITRQLPADRMDESRFVASRSASMSAPISRSLAGISGSW
jgi:DNA replication protein DnaC